MDKTPIFKITDYIERDLKWEEKECNSIGIDFNYYQLKEGFANEATASSEDVAEHAIMLIMETTRICCKPGST